jgi:hypothetical protein
MSKTPEREPTPAPRAEQEPVTITVKRLEKSGAGFFEVTVKVDDHAPGKSVTRTSPKAFAYPRN